MVDLTPEEQKKVDQFRARLEKFAKAKGFRITNIKGWTESSIRQMALDPKHKCCCRPDERICPCKEGVKEVETSGECLCSVFKRG